MFSALCLAPVAAMLDAKTAWRLDRTSRRVVVCWDEIGTRMRCRTPSAVGAGLSGSRFWTVRGALALIDDAAATPFHTKANLLRYFFRYALTPQQLYDVGCKAHHVATMRLALRLSRMRRVKLLENKAIF